MKKQVRLGKILIGLRKTFATKLALVMLLGIMPLNAMTASGTEQTVNTEVPNLQQSNGEFTSENDTVLGGNSVGGMQSGSRELSTPYDELVAMGGGDPTDDITEDFICLNFRAAVREIAGLGSEQPILRSHVEGRTELSVNGKEITSLDGIEHFAALELLLAHHNELTELNVSNNGELKQLIVGNNQLTTLDVSSNTSLVSLSAMSNELTTLTLGTLPDLEILQVGDNDLSGTLDISGLANLKNLDVSNNRLTGLNITANESLQRLDVTRNLILLTSDIIGWEDDCDNLKLAPIDVWSDPYTFFFYPQRKDITASFTDPGFEAAVRELIKKPIGPIFESDVDWWGWLNVSFNPYAGDPTECTCSPSCECGDSPCGCYSIQGGTKHVIESLAGIEHFSALTGLDVLNQQLTTLDVSSNLALEYLYAWNNRLTGLDITANTNLQGLDVTRNFIPSPDYVIGWEAIGLNLAPINVWGEQYTFFFYPQFAGSPPTGANITASFTDPGFLAAVREVIGKPTEPILDYDVAFIERLDVSFNPYAGDPRECTCTPSCECGNSPCGCYGIQGGTKHVIESLAGIEHFNALTNLNVSDQQLTTLDLPANTALRDLRAQRNQLTSLDVSNNPALSQLDVNDNQLSTLDVSQNAVLDNLWARNNRLTSLDVMNNPALRQLDVGHNLLTELDVSNSSELSWLNVASNFIPSLNDVIEWDNGVLTVGENFIFYPQFAGTPPTGADITTSFTDPGFLAAVREIIGKPTEPILDYDVALITTLNVNYHPRAGLPGICECYDCGCYDCGCGSGIVGGTKHVIESLAGIEHFSALTNLNVSGQQLTTLDVSALTALESLNAGENNLTVLTLGSNLTNLRWLHISDNNLSGTLNVSALTALESFYAWDNNLTGLTLGSTLTNLRQLSVGENKLTTLDVSNLPALESLDAWNNNITTLRLGSHPNLRWLSISDNNLSGTLNVSAFTTLESLNAGGNNLTGLTLGNNLTNLRWLGISNNRIGGTLNVSSLAALESLDAWGNDLRGLTLGSNLTSLRQLHISDNNLSGTLNVSAFTTLESLNAGGNNLTGLTLGNNLTNLQHLSIGGNNLSRTLDVSSLTALESLYAWGNNFTGLTLGNNLTNLRWLGISSNRIGDTLDVSSLTALESLDAWNNNLTGLTLGSGLTNLQWLDISNNRIGDTLNVSSLAALESLYAGGNNFTELILGSDLTNLRNLHVGGNNLSGTLDVSDLTALRSFYAWDNDLTGLTLGSNLTNLQHLGIGNNRIGGTLDVSDLTALETLEAWGNNLTGLTLVNLPALVVLQANNNSLTTLDLSGTPLLQVLVVEMNFFENFDAIVGLENTKIDVNREGWIPWIDADWGEYPDWIYTPPFGFIFYPQRQHGTQTRPSVAPTAANITPTSVTLTHTTLPLADLEFMVNRANRLPDADDIANVAWQEVTGVWQTSPIFGDLTPNTDYWFFARRRASTPELAPSPASPSRIIRTTTATLIDIRTDGRPDDTALLGTHTSTYIDLVFAVGDDVSGLGLRNHNDDIRWVNNTVAARTITRGVPRLLTPDEIRDSYGETNVTTYTNRIWRVPVSGNFADRDVLELTVLRNISRNVDEVTLRKDVTPPVMVGDLTITTDGRRIILTFSEALSTATAHRPTAAQLTHSTAPHFTVTFDSDRVNIGVVEVVDSQVILTMERAAFRGQDITVEYTGARNTAGVPLETNRIRDLAGNMIEERIFVPYTDIDTDDIVLGYGKVLNVANTIDRLGLEAADHRITEGGGAEPVVNVAIIPPSAPSPTGYIGITSVRTGTFIIQVSDTEFTTPALENQNIATIRGRVLGDGSILIDRVDRFIDTTPAPTGEGRYEIDYENETITFIGPIRFAFTNNHITIPTRAQLIARPNATNGTVQSGDTFTVDLTSRLDRSTNANRQTLYVWNHNVDLTTGRNEDLSTVVNELRQQLLEHADVVPLIRTSGDWMNMFAVNYAPHNRGVDFSVSDGFNGRTVELANTVANLTARNDNQTVTNFTPFYASGEVGGTPGDYVAFVPLRAIPAFNITMQARLRGCNVEGEFASAAVAVLVRSHANAGTWTAGGVANFVEYNGARLGTDPRDSVDSQWETAVLSGVGPRGSLSEEHVNWLKASGSSIARWRTPNDGHTYRWEIIVAGNPVPVHSDVITDGEPLPPRLYNHIDRATNATFRILRVAESGLPAVASSNFSFAQLPTRQNTAAVNRTLGTIPHNNTFEFLVVNWGVEAPGDVHRVDAVLLDPNAPPPAPHIVQTWTRVPGTAINIQSNWAGSYVYVRRAATATAPHGTLGLFSAPPAQRAVPTLIRSGQDAPVNMSNIIKNDNINDMFIFAPATGRLTINPNIPNELIILGFARNSAIEISQNGNFWFAAGNTDIRPFLSGAGQGYNSIYVRLRGNANTAPSDALGISINLQTANISVEP